MTRAPFLLAALAACSVGHAQDPLKTLPGNYKLIVDTPDFAVIRAHYGAHEKIPVHDHTSFATVFVYLSNSGPVRIDHAEEGRPPESVTRPPTTLGAYRIAAGITERHSIENLSELDSDFLRVELKRVNLALPSRSAVKLPRPSARRPIPWSSRTRSFRSSGSSAPRRRRAPLLPGQGHRC